MSSPLDPVRDRDRAVARRLVEQAHARGQIVDLDRDHRLQQLGAAHTVADVEMVVRDLRAPGPMPAVDALPATPAPAPPATRATTVGVPPGSVPYGAPAPVAVYRPPTRQRNGCGCAVVVVVVAIVGVVVSLAIGLVAFVATDVDETGGTGEGFVTEPTPPAPRVLTETGLADLRAAILDRTGSDEVSDLSLYPEYAVVTVPAGGGRRVRNLHWDGELSSTGPGTARPSTRPFALSEIEGAVLVAVLREARRDLLRSEPDDWYVLVRHDDGTAGPHLWAYVSTDAGRGGYLEARLDGTEVRRVTW